MCIRDRCTYHAVAPPSWILPKMHFEIKVCFVFKPWVIEENTLLPYIGFEISEKKVPSLYKWLENMQLRFHAEGSFSKKLNSKKFLTATFLWLLSFEFLNLFGQPFMWYLWEFVPWVIPWTRSGLWTISFHVNWRKEKLKFLCWLFLTVFLDGNNQRTNIDAGGGYSVITVRRFRPRDVK